MTSSQSLDTAQTTSSVSTVQSLSKVENPQRGSAFLQTLLTKKIVTQSSTQCSICLESEFVDEAKLDGCSHRYCFLCIFEWSKNTNTCPQCKSEFTAITRVNASGKKRTRAEQNGVLKVKRRKQRADYDEEELHRLGYIDNEADDDDDDDDDDDEDEDDDIHNGIAGYSNDGFVVTNDVIEYEDDEDDNGRPKKKVVVDLEEEIGDYDSVDDEEDSDESSCSTSSSISLKSEGADDEDDDIQIVQATNSGRVVPIVTLRSQSSRMSSGTRRSLRISCMAN